MIVIIFIPFSVTFLYNINKGSAVKRIRGGEKVWILFLRRCCGTAQPWISFNFPYAVRNAKKSGKAVPFAFQKPDRQQKPKEKK